VDPPHVPRTWATPRYPGLRKQLAQIAEFHLVWRDGALQPVGLARAPRDPQARDMWIDTAANQWLVLSVEGRRLLTRMQRLPSGFDITFDPNGNWSILPKRTHRTDAATNATSAAIGAWFVATPQGKRALQRLRDRARDQASPPPAPPTSATTPATTTPSTTPPPAVATPQPQPAAATTPTTGPNAPPTAP
jgi:hypothetical protein